MSPTSSALLAAFMAALAVLAGCSSTQSTGEIGDKVMWAEASFEVLSAEVEGDTLLTVVRYGGGCGQHRFELEANGPLMKSLPPKQPLRWVHRSPGDPCRALISDTVRAALLPFRGTPHGTTVLHLEGHDANLIYTYR
jgi:hypothetical protein